MKIKIISTFVVIAFALTLVGTGCRGKKEVELTDVGTEGEPGIAPEAEGTTPIMVPGAENVAIMLINPNDAELDLAAKNISRHAKIKITYDGELSEYELMLGSGVIDVDVVSQSDGELILKPKKPMHNLKEYT
ncbi:hypothetical protein KA005_62955, partial [bacterium]|nr:hypothetical protein [bacterium]